MVDSRCMRLSSWGGDGESVLIWVSTNYFVFDRSTIV